MTLNERSPASSTLLYYRAIERAQKQNYFVYRKHPGNVSYGFCGGGPILRKKTLLVMGQGLLVVALFRFFVEGI